MRTARRVRDLLNENRHCGRPGNNAATNQDNFPESMPQIPRGVSRHTGFAHAILSRPKPAGPAKLQIRPFGRRVGPVDECVKCRVSPFDPSLRTKSAFLIFGRAGGASHTCLNLPTSARYPSRRLRGQKAVAADQVQAAAPSGTGAGETSSSTGFLDASPRLPAGPAATGRRYEPG